MPDWRHEVDPRWMKTRKRLLTASQIESIIPYTSTGRKRSESSINDATIKIFSDMMSDELSTVSVGAAARGHIMEPWAARQILAYHWDDIVISNIELGLGWSPDGSIDMPQPHDGPAGPFIIDCDSAPMKHGIEIKCYSPQRHYEVMLQEPKDRKEKWQIATAFATVPTLKKMTLVLCNPNVKDQFFTHLYLREDLDEEIAEVESVAEDFWKRFDRLRYSVDSLSVSGCLFTEDDVWEDWHAKNEAEASVINPN